MVRCTDHTPETKVDMVNTAVFDIKVVRSWINQSEKTIL